MNIFDIARSADVTRWHSVPCYRYPSVAEHSFLVTMYANKIIDKIESNISQEEKLNLLQFCLWHDVPEILTGDMATPIKRRLEALFPDIPSPIETLEEELCFEYKYYKNKLSDLLRRVAKLADIMEAIKFIDTEGKGFISKHILSERKKVFFNLITDSKKLYPDLKWHEVDNILDELLNGSPTTIDFVDSFK